MDQRTVNGCFIGYSKGFKEYRFYCPKHSSRIVKIENTKYIKLDKISVNTKLREVIFEKAQVDVPIPITSENVLIHLIDYHDDTLKQVNNHSSQIDNTTTDESCLESPE